MLRVAVPLALMFSVGCAVAQQPNFDRVEIRAEPVKPGIAALFGAGGNMVVSHGPDGTVLIDDQFAPLTPRIQAAIARLGAAPVKYLINTHWHGDHAGGNANFGGAGAILIAQDEVRTRLAAGATRGAAATAPAPAVALPVVTYRDSVTLHLNGDTLRLVHVPAAHTDGDTVVFWQRANVVHMGDVFFNRVTLPFIDLDSGGSARGMLAAVDRVLAMTNDATVIIPGHGPVARRADLVAYRAMLAEVIDAVARGRAAGRTLAQIVAARPAARWDTNPDAFIKGDAFVTAVHTSLAATPAPRRPNR